MLVPVYNSMMAHTEEIVSLYGQAIDEVFGEIAQSLSRGDVTERLKSPLRTPAFNGCSSSERDRKQREPLAHNLVLQQDLRGSSSVSRVRLMRTSEACHRSKLHRLRNNLTDRSDPTDPTDRHFQLRITRYELRIFPGDL